MSVIPLPADVEIVTGSTRGAQLWRVLRRDPLSIMSLTIILIYLLMSLFAPWVAPYPAQGAGKSNPPTVMLPPSPQHWMGTDQLGRDVFSRVIFGGRPAFIVPLLVVGLAVLIGAPLGAIAGFKGGWFDETIMRITDLFLAFPSLLLAMAITAALGRGLENAALALVISWWPWYARIVRGASVSLRDRYFVEAAHSMGVREPVIVARHILPNCLTPILIQATIDLGTVILAMGGLAFLGMGTQPPAADWGLMISEGRTSILNAWWIAIFPMLAMMILVLAFNLLGDVLRDFFDPRHYR
ncbi:MAG: ABC transporter permease [Anaerolineales bacterium]|nr:ABC transporter permease [Anaerolineales bacterium]